MARAQVGFQPRNTPAERRAFFDLQRKHRASSGPFLYYQYSNVTTPPPGSGNIQLSPTPQTASTRAYLSDITTDALDLHNFIGLSVGLGSVMLLQDKNDHTRYQLYAVLGKPIEHTGYSEIPISWVRGGVAIPNAQACFVIFAHG